MINKKYTNDTTIIERDSKRNLENSLSISNRIFPYINYNDKTPSWDGYIFITDSTGFKKDGIRIPIQLKGTVVLNFSNSVRTDSVYVKDLINFRRDGGVLYLIVELKSHNDAKIFSQELLPSDIDKILKDKSHQKTVTVNFNHLNLTDANTLEYKLEQFHTELHNQNSATRFLYNMKPNEYAHSKFNFNNPRFREDFTKYILNNRIYIHQTEILNGLVKDYARKIEFTEITTTISGNVIVNDKTHFDSYRVVKNKNEDIIIINDFLKINLTSTHVYFKNSGSLHQRINNLEFLFDLIKYENLSIEDILHASGVRLDGNIEEYKDEYDFLIATKNLLRFFSIEDDLDIDNLTDDEFNQLNYLIDIVLYNKKLPIEDNSVGTYLVKLSNISILLSLFVDKNKNVKIYDIFSSDFDINDLKFKYENNGKVHDNINVYFLLTTDYLSRASNINFKKIHHEIQYLCTSNNKDYIYSYINQLGLNILSAYDITLNKDAIACSINLFKILIDIEHDTSLSLLNLYQCYIRIRNLIDREHEKLFEIRKYEQKKSNSNYLVLWACSVLLENKADMNYYFNRLQNKEKKDIKQYPIYTLFEESK